MSDRISVVVLNWNGEKLLRQFLPSVVQHSNPEISRVVVVDNASTDHSVRVLKEEFPEVELLCLDRNYGFAEGYNRAIEAIESEYVVLLNSDVEVADAWLEPLLELMDSDKKLAAVQPKILAYNEKNKFEYAGACGGYMDRWGYPFCRGRILEVTEEDRGQYDSIAEIFWASGAALFIRRDLYLKHGGLDKDFFAHMEEIDLCWRLRNAGYTLKVNPLSVVYHLGGGSLPMNHPKKLFLNFRNNLLMLYKNLSREERGKILGVRFFLDMASWCVFVLKGQFKNAGSVYKAYISFRKMKKNYSDISPKRSDACIYRKSIVYAYFVKKITAFSDLMWDQ
ncbi:glycosyltransferase family 2 protein [Porphyromonadaceae bacterium OttesenSCG-928-L07]|nr:glycosyltransferase family 2 protein [Porphyromonadaceae bacterium OttesenSCG-928-L07]MDL2252145.1 glycosyltransferase family 2 protein [Odoribacter sp. OttesenSCG-928-J03]